MKTVSGYMFRLTGGHGRNMSKKPHTYFDIMMCAVTPLLVPTWFSMNIIMCSKVEPSLGR